MASFALWACSRHLAKWSYNWFLSWELHHREKFQRSCENHFLQKYNFETVFGYDKCKSQPCPPPPVYVDGMDVCWRGTCLPGVRTGTTPLPAPGCSHLDHSGKHLLAAWHLYTASAPLGMPIHSNQKALSLSQKEASMAPSHGTNGFQRKCVIFVELFCDPFVNHRTFYQQLLATV